MLEEKIIYYEKINNKDKIIKGYGESLNPYGLGEDEGKRIKLDEKPKPTEQTQAQQQPVAEQVAEEKPITEEHAEDFFIDDDIFNDIVDDEVKRETINLPEEKDAVKTIARVLDSVRPKYSFGELMTEGKFGDRLLAYYLIDHSQVVERLKSGKIFDETVKITGGEIKVGDKVVVSNRKDYRYTGAGSEGVVTQIDGTIAYVKFSKIIDGTSGGHGGRETWDVNVDSLDRVRDVRAIGTAFPRSKKVTGLLGLLSIDKSSAGGEVTKSQEYSEPDAIAYLASRELIGRYPLLKKVYAKIANMDDLTRMLKIARIGANLKLTDVKKLESLLDRDISEMLDAAMDIVAPEYNPLKKLVEKKEDLRKIISYAKKLLETDKKYELAFGLQCLLGDAFAGKTETPGVKRLQSKDDYLANTGRECIVRDESGEHKGKLANCQCSSRHPYHAYKVLIGEGKKCVRLEEITLTGADGLVETDNQKVDRLERLRVQGLKELAGDEKKLKKQLDKRVKTAFKKIFHDYYGSEEGFRPVGPGEVPERTKARILVDGVYYQGVAYETCCRHPKFQLDEGQNLKMDGYCLATNGLAQCPVEIRCNINQYLPEKGVFDYEAYKSAISAIRKTLDDKEKIKFDDIRKESEKKLKLDGRVQELERLSQIKVALGGQDGA